MMCEKRGAAALFFSPFSHNLPRRGLQFEPGDSILKVSVIPLIYCENKNKIT